MCFPSCVRNSILTNFFYCHDLFFDKLRPAGASDCTVVYKLLKRVYNTCMNVNYDLLFEQEKQKLQNASAKLLLHVCCAPCATQCLVRLVDTFDVTLFFANDNITDFDEWQKRLGEVRKLVEIVNNGGFEMVPKHPLKLVVQQFDSQRFFATAKGLEGEKEGGARCERCFALRLADTLRFAEQKGFDLFCTTLTVSPYKNSQLLNKIGESLQSETVRWLPADFKKRNGYNESIRLSQKYGLYRQHYCGCVFSDFLSNQAIQEQP